MAPTPGIIWVASQITRPTRLTPSKFVAWYENTHVDEVVALSGVPAAARYEQVDILPEGTKEEERPAWLIKAPWLTVYEMRDVEFRRTQEFRGLDGQKEPAKELLEGVFKNAGFETRFAELVQVDEVEGARRGVLVSFSVCWKLSRLVFCCVGE